MKEYIGFNIGEFLYDTSSPKIKHDKLPLFCQGFHKGFIRKPLKWLDIEFSGVSWNVYINILNIIGFRII